MRLLAACGKECAVEGRVASVSRSSFLLFVDSVGTEKLSNSVEIRLFATADSLAEGKRVRLPEITRASSKIGGPAYRTDRVEILPKGTGTFARVRQRLGEATDRLYPREESALARGVLFGDGTAISEEGNLAYRGSGLSHLVVASGGNIAVVAGMLAVFAKRLPYGLRLFVLVSGIWAYAALAGTGIPVVRAAMMASVAVLAEPFFRTDPIVLLFAVGLAMVLHDPGIATNASFLLSFSATLGIATLATKASENLLSVPKGFSLRETLAATLSATVATIPVSLVAFGSLSTLSIVSNMLAIPVLAYATLPTLAALSLDAFGWTSLATPIGSIGYSALAWTNFVAEKIATVPYSTIAPIESSLALVSALGSVGFFLLLTARAVTALPNGPALKFGIPTPLAGTPKASGLPRAEP